MKKNKYIIFAAIGFELIGFIIAGILIGDGLAKTTGYQIFKALMIVLGFLIWFISLIAKLKSLEDKKDKD